MYITHHIHQVSECTEHVIIFCSSTGKTMSWFKLWYRELAETCKATGSHVPVRVQCNPIFGSKKSYNATYVWLRFSVSFTATSLFSNSKIQKSIKRQQLNWTVPVNYELVHRDTSEPGFTPWAVCQQCGISNMIQSKYSWRMTSPCFLAGARQPVWLRPEAICGSLIRWC